MSTNVQSNKFKESKVITRQRPKCDSSSHASNQLALPIHPSSSTRCSSQNKFITTGGSNHEGSLGGDYGKDTHCDKIKPPHIVV